MIVLHYEQHLLFTTMSLVNLMDCPFARCSASSPIIGGNCRLRYPINAGDGWDVKFCLRVPYNIWSLFVFSHLKSRTYRFFLEFIYLKVLTSKPTGKRPLGRPRRRWEDNIGMDLK